MSRVLIVGAGLTGSLCACLLRRELQGRVQVVVWDKAGGAGGRMSTSRPPDASSHSADLGAQYITATPAYAQSHHSFYSELLCAGVLQPLDCHIEGLQQKDGNKNYVTPRGTSNVVKHFLSESGADLFLQHHVTGVYRRGASWEVARKAGDSETFDAVVLTMPVPQILQLQGDLVTCKSLRTRTGPNCSQRDPTHSHMTCFEKTSLTTHTCLLLLYSVSFLIHMIFRFLSTCRMF
uniref:Renalase, FAD-dependent amine oxidase n=1 Tax=Kryptolebias marmoratus TaxID=37003 RepID=A0A3Q3A5G5_KRYMA